MVKVNICHLKSPSIIKRKRENTKFLLVKAALLFSLYAAEAGASRVYACEASEVMAITAADVFRYLNNFDGGKKVLKEEINLNFR